MALTGSRLASAAVDAAPGILGSRLVGDWLGASLANVLLSPFSVAAVLITLELSGSSATAAKERPPAHLAAGVADATGPSSPANGDRARMSCRQGPPFAEQGSAGRVAVGAAAHAMGRLGPAVGGGAGS